MVRDEPTDVAIDEDEEYKSSEDEDFNPDEVAVPQDDDGLSSSEDDAPQQAKKAPKKRKKVQVDAEGLDSGDEVTIKEPRRSKKRKGEEVEEESGGEGGLVKTRAQRKAEKQERQEYQKANVDNATVDVDVLWAFMSSKPLGRPPPEPPKASIAISNQDAKEASKDDEASATAKDEDEDGMITIQRSYDFAGQTVTEEKRVHKNSAEAKLFLASNDPAKQSKPQQTQATDGNHQTLRRPLRRASKFEPNPTGEVKGLPTDRQRLRTPSRADVLAQQKRLEEEAAKKGKAVKLNTVQKSAIDWAAHVDEEGFQEELDEYGRSKQGYLGKMDFLRGVHGKKEDEDRRVRLAQSGSA